MGETPARKPEQAPTVPSTASGTGPVLDVSGLSVAVGGGAGRLAVSGLSLRVDPGKVVALVGESGCGKSLTALAVMGLLPKGARVFGGSIRVADTEVVGASERRLRRMRGSTAAMVFQDPMMALNPLQPIGVQIAEPLRIHTPMDRAARRDRVLELLDAVGIPDPRTRARQRPFEFSGGLRQRVMIAVALACRPRLLIADEPTTALDVTIQAQILDLLRDLTRGSDTAVLFITHDMGVVAEMADQVAVMYAGQAVENAPVAELFGRPAHPYTDALLGSVPRSDTPTTADLPTIPGRVPAPGEAPSGCPFRERCAEATGRCLDRPDLTTVRTGHRVACWHPHHVQVPV